MSNGTKVAVGIGGVVAIIAIILCVMPSPPQKAESEMVSAGTKKLAAKSITNVVIVTDRPTRVDVPFGYTMKYSYGYAPLDTRSSCDPEWLPTDKAPQHLNGGKLVQWREWRVHEGYEPARAEVICVFTQEES